MIQEKRYIHAADPTVKYFPPTPKDAVPYLDFSGLQNAMSALEKEAQLLCRAQSSQSKTEYKSQSPE